MDILLKNKLAIKKFFLCYLFFLGISNLQATTNILFLGDSLTEGYGIEQKNSYPMVIERKLISNNYQDIKIINAGISGSTSATALSRLKWYLPINLNIMVLALGANDGLRGLSVMQMRKNIANTIELAQKNNIQVILAGMKIPPNYGLQYTKKFENTFNQLAKKYNIPLIPFLLKDVATIKSLNLPDGIHPNEKGQKIIAKNVYPYIVKEIKKLQK